MSSTATPAAPKEVPAQFGLARIGRHSAIYALGMLISKAIAFVMLPVYTRYLTPADYGVLQLVSMMLEVVSIIAGSRIAAGIFHFYHKAEGDDAKRSVLSTAYFLLAMTYVAVGVLTVLFAPWIADIVFSARGDYVLLIQVAVASLAFEGLFLVPMSHIQLRERSGAYVGVQVIRLVLQLILNIILLIPFRMGVLGVLLSSLTANALVGGYLGVSMLRGVGLRVRTPVAKDLLRFGLPLVGMQVAGFIIAFGDRYFLNKHAGEAAVGLYGLAYQFGYLLITVGYIPFHRVWDPMRFAVAKRPDRDSVFARVFVFANLMVVTLGVVIGLFGGDFIRIVSTPDYHAAASLVPIMMLVFVLHAWSYFHGTGMLVTERTLLITLAHWLAAGVAVLGYLVIIPRYTILGATFVAAAAYGTRFVCLYTFSQRVWPVAYRWSSVLRVFAVGAVVCGVAQMLPRFPVLITIPIHVALVGAYLAGIWFLGGFSGTDRAAILEAVRSPRSFMTVLRGTP